MQLSAFLKYGIASASGMKRSDQCIKMGLVGCQFGCLYFGLCICTPQELEYALEFCHFRASDSRLVHLGANGSWRGVRPQGTVILWMRPTKAGQEASGRFTQKTAVSSWSSGFTSRFIELTGRLDIESRISNSSLWLALLLPGTQRIYHQSRPPAKSARFRRSNAVVKV